MGSKAAARHGKLGPAGSAAVAKATGAEGDDPAEGAVPDVDRPEVGNNNPADDKDRAILVGGPGQEERPFSFKYGEQEFDSPESLQTYLDDLNTKIRTKPAEGAKPVTPATPAVVTAPAVIRDPIEDAMKDFSEEEFFKNPKATMKAMLAKGVDIARADVMSKQAAINNMKDFWTDFYTTHKDLGAKKEVVVLVMNEHEKALAPLSMADASKELGRLTREKLTSWGIAPAKPEKTPRTVVEGAGKKEEVKKEEQVATQAAALKGTTLTGAIKARQAARRAAQTA